MPSAVVAFPSARSFNNDVASTSDWRVLEFRPKRAFGMAELRAYRKTKARWELLTDGGN